MIERFKVDPTLMLLFLGIFAMTGILIFCEHFFASDGQIFQVISGLVTGFAGAFFGRINPKPAHEETKTSTDTTNTTNIIEAKP